VRITYDRGRMGIVSPLPIHERIKKILGQMIELATLEAGIDRASLGQTTWRRRDLAKGLEADECYYIQHEPQVRGRDDIDLKRDPPPDLVVEVDIRHASPDRASIYAAMGVPEVWRYDGERVSFLRLEQGKYEIVNRSDALPFITSDDVNRFLLMFPATGEVKLISAFRDWVRANK